MRTCLSSRVSEYQMCRHTSPWKGKWHGYGSPSQPMTEPKPDVIFAALTNAAQAASRRAGFSRTEWREGAHRECIWPFGSSVWSLQHCGVSSSRSVVEVLGLGIKVWM